LDSKNLSSALNDIGGRRKHYDTFSIQKDKIPPVFTPPCQPSSKLNLDTRPKSKAGNFIPNLMELDTNFSKLPNMVEINEKLRSRVST
jgi:hypothetical protein